MTTVARRTFSSSPKRDALTTWDEIVVLLTRLNADPRSELVSVAGIAGSIIGDKACEKAPIIVSCEGPQTRIYCLYDDNAVEGSDTNEDILGFDPLKGDWSISLPCEADDLDWVQSALKQKSVRVTARDKTETNKQAAEATQASAPLVIDTERLLNS